MENTTGEVKNLTPNGTVCLHYNQPGTSFNDCSTRYYIHVNNQQYNPSFLGKYWCQVINTTADPDQPLMRSNVFTLLPPDDYTYSEPRCSTPHQYIDITTCADLIEQSKSSLILDSTATIDFAKAHSTGINQTKQGLE